MTLIEGSWWGWELGLPHWEPVLGSGPNWAWDCPGLGECGVGVLSAWTPLPTWVAVFFGFPLPGPLS